MDSDSDFEHSKTKHELLKFEFQTNWKPKFDKNEIDHALKLNQFQEDFYQNEVTGRKDFNKEMINQY